MPSPGIPIPNDLYDAHTDDVLGSGPCGGRSEEDRLSFEDEDDYGRQPRVLEVRYSLLLLASAFTLFFIPLGRE